MLSDLDVLTFRDDRPGTRNGDVSTLHRIPVQDALRITFLDWALRRNDHASSEGISTGRPGLAIRMGVPHHRVDAFERTPPGGEVPGGIN
jgi:hypothetical protein